MLYLSCLSGILTHHLFPIIRLREATQPGCLTYGLIIPASASGHEPGRRKPYTLLQTRAGRRISNTAGAAEHECKAINHSFLILINTPSK